MDPNTALKNVESEMKKSVEFLQKEFVGIRTGKASPALVENLDINVTSYGSVMKLQGLAVITTPEARTIMVSPFDPSTIGDIDKGIRETNLGFNPVSDGKTLRIPIPEPTEERRKELAKAAKGFGEEAKIRIRSCRKEGMDTGKKLKADNALNEDGQKDFEKDVQELTDKYVKTIEEMVSAKDKEIMTV